MNYQLTLPFKEVKRMTDFQSVYTKYQDKGLTCYQAAQLLGCSERHFRRIRDRYKSENEDITSIIDKRIGHKPTNKIACDEIAEMLTLYREKYYDFNAKHFHEKLCSQHSKTYSYNWVRTTLQSKGLITKGKRKNVHRKKRERRPMPGMMLHQDGSRHLWIEELDPLDLIVTMDDANSEIYSMFLTEEEGTQSTFLGLYETMNKHGLPSSFYTDRGSHYVTTRDGKIDKANLTQVGRALKQLSVQAIYAYSPEARGRSERMFGTLQGRLPQEFRLNNISTVAQANEFLKNKFIPEFNKVFMKDVKEEGIAFTPYLGKDLLDILSIQAERTVRNDNTISYNNLLLQIPQSKHRYHYVKCKVMVHEYYDGKVSIFHGPHKLASYDSEGKNIEQIVAKTNNSSKLLEAA